MSMGAIPSFPPITESERAEWLKRKAVTEAEMSEYIDRHNDNHMHAVPLLSLLDPYGINDEPDTPPVQNTPPREPQVGDRIAANAVDGSWIGPLVIAELTERGFVTENRTVFEHGYGGGMCQWRYFDEQPVSPPAPVWTNCRFTVDRKKDGSPIPCNRGFLQPRAIYDQGRFNCPSHDPQPYNGPAYRAPMSEEARAGYDDVLGEAAA